MERAGLSADDVDLVIPHQANLRIIQNSVQRQLRIPEDKIYVNLQKYGNTSTASIPIALCEAIKEQKSSAGRQLDLRGLRRWADLGRLRREVGRTDGRAGARLVAEHALAGRLSGSGHAQYVAQGATLGVPGLAD